MAASARPRPVGRPWLVRLPSPASADVALVTLLAAYSVFVTVFVPGLWPGPRWPAVIVGVLQTLPVLWRRSHPGIGLAAYCVSKPVQYTVAPVSEWTWLVLVYSLFAYRRLRVAALVLGLTVLVTYPSSAAIISAARGESFLSVLGAFALYVTPQLVVAAGLGWAVRASRARTIRQRERVYRARVATEIGRERERIADELSSVVVTRLDRVVARTQQLRAQLEDSSRSVHQVLSEVHDEARQALAALRRTLGFLRSERSAPDPTAAERTMRRASLQAPTLSGIALVCACVAAAVYFDITTSARPPADEMQAKLWPTMFLHYDQPLGLLLLFVQFAVLGWWRSAPLSALGVGTVAESAAFLLHAGDNYVTGFSSMLLAYAAGAGAGPVVSALAVSGATLTYLAVYLVGEHYVPRYSFPASALVLGFLLSLLLWAIGALQRRVTLRIRQRAEDRSAEAVRVALALERNRIARELHDVLGHYVSAIVVQAGAARSVAATEPDVVREAIGHIEESGRRILDALPALLDRQPGGEAVAAPVRLDKDGVEQLVAPLRSAGLPVTIDVRGEASQGDAAQPPDEVELFAQRILMEALTNVLRHAGPTPTRVRLDHQAEALTIEVADAGPVAGHRPAQDGGGHGLVGMRERAELLGGELSAGRHGERGWLVQARLPRTRVGGDVLLLAEDTGPPGKSSLARTRDKDSPP